MFRLLSSYKCCGTEDTFLSLYFYLLFTFCDNWKLRRGSELRLMKDRNLLVFSAFTKEFLTHVKYIVNQQAQCEYSSRDTQQKVLLTCPSFPAFGCFVEGENSILLNTRLLDLKRIIWNYQIKVILLYYITIVFYWTHGS